MQIFIDSANIDEIRELHDYGIISGVTTNPSLLAKSSNNIYNTIKIISEAVRSNYCPISVEVTATNYKDMIKEGEKIYNISENIELKLPMTWDGLKACNYFSRKDLLVNMTLCFSFNQVILATEAGASHASIFIGRLDDIGFDGTKVIENISKTYHGHNSCEIIAASIRHPQHIQSAALSGADIATAPYSVIKKLIDHPLTDIGLQKFIEDWEKSSLKI